jgi:hypothetical protein
MHKDAMKSFSKPFENIKFPVMEEINLSEHRKEN